jgi:hypothetical protein
LGTCQLPKLLLLLLLFYHIFEKSSKKLHKSLYISVLCDNASAFLIFVARYVLIAPQKEPVCPALG